MDLTRSSILLWPAVLIALPPRESWVICSLIIDVCEADVFSRSVC